MADKPNAPACLRNQTPIFEVMGEYVDESNKHLLEIGSGTGQHSVFLTSGFPNLTWTTSDLEENHDGIRQWIRDSKEGRIAGPLTFDIGCDTFPDGNFDIIFTANTFHIISWDLVQKLIGELKAHLKSNALFMVYGPFNYKGEYTSKSNEEFDFWLKNRDPQSAIRSFEDVENKMNQSGLFLVRDHEMPANNRFLVFKKK